MPPCSLGAGLWKVKRLQASIISGISQDPILDDPWDAITTSRATPLACSASGLSLAAPCTRKPTELAESCEQEHTKNYSAMFITPHSPTLHPTASDSAGNWGRSGCEQPILSQQQK